MAAGQDLTDDPLPRPLRSHLMNSSRWTGSIAEPQPLQSVVLSLQASHPWDGGQGCLPETGVSTPPLSSSPGQPGQWDTDCLGSGRQPPRLFCIGMAAYIFAADQAS